MDSTPVLTWFLVNPFPPHFCHWFPGSQKEHCWNHVFSRKSSKIMVLCTSMNTISFFEVRKYCADSNLPFTFAMEFRRRVEREHFRQLMHGHVEPWIWQNRVFWVWWDWIEFTPRHGIDPTVTRFFHFWLRFCCISFVSKSSSTWGLLPDRFGD